LPTSKQTEILPYLLSALPRPARLIARRPKKESPAEAGLSIQRRYRLAVLILVVLAWLTLLALTTLAALTGAILLLLAGLLPAALLLAGLLVTLLILLVLALAMVRILVLVLSHFNFLSTSTRRSLV
jgi:hypothetical protein